MNFDADTRAQITADMTLSFDPTGTSVEIEIDGEWHSADWLDSPVEVTAGKKWTQSAQTGYFAGPNVDSPGSATVLTLGRHTTQTRVTSGQTIITQDSSPVDVK